MNQKYRGLLEHLMALATEKRTSLFVVGGTLRDRLLGFPVSDLDVTAKQISRIAREFAQQTHLPWVTLDDSPGRETIRVVANRDVYFDFTEMQGETIEQDLRQRDFTINALAVPLSDFLKENLKPIDPNNGRQDLDNRIIRAVSNSVLVSDPLRLLRAFRFSSTLDFDIDENTMGQIERHRAGMKGVAPERIYYELMLFLDCASAHTHLLQMDRCGLLDYVLPEIADLKNQTASKKNWKRILDSFGSLERILNGPVEILELHSVETKDFLNQQRARIKLAVLLQGLDLETKPLENQIDKNWNGQPCAAEALKRLRASNKDIEFITGTIKHQRQADNSALAFALQPRDLKSLYRYVKNCENELIPALLLACAFWKNNLKDQAEEWNRRLEAVREVARFYFAEYLPAQKEDVLLNGDDLIQCFHLDPSPLFRNVLDQVEEARVLGTIRTRDEAVRMAKNIIEN